jgi:hypothetical protein
VDPKDRNEIDNVIMLRRETLKSFKTEFVMEGFGFEKISKG